MQTASQTAEEAIVAETFLVDYARENGTAVVRFIGELDMADAERAVEAGIAALAGRNGDRSPLVIDVSELTFCDSTGLHALLTIRDKAQAGGRAVVLRKPSAMLLRLLDLTDLRSVFIFEG